MPGRGNVTSPDWLLVYKIIAGELILALMRTGAHAELGLS